MMNFWYKVSSESTSESVLKISQNLMYILAIMALFLTHNVLNCEEIS